jgi:HTH-type transcriptional regulator / antitoxin HigA
LGTIYIFDKSKTLSMTHNIIKSKKQYNAALERLEEIFDAKKNSALGDELELLSLLIENYENKFFALEHPDPIEAIKFKLDQLGMKQQDLANAIGLKSRASEILNRKRKLTLEHIRKIHQLLGISLEILVKEY